LKGSIVVIALLGMTANVTDVAAQNGPLVAIDAVRATDQPWSEYQGESTDFNKPDVTKASPDKALGLFIRIRAQAHGGYLSSLCKWTRGGKRIGNVREVETRDFYMPGTTVWACQIAPNPVWQELGEYKVELQVDGAVVATRTIEVAN